MLTRLQLLALQRREIIEQLRQAQGDAEEIFGQDPDYNNPEFVRCCKEADKCDAKIEEIDRKIAKAKERAILGTLSKRTHKQPELKKRRGIGSY
jgi:hypothetical protein